MPSEPLRGFWSLLYIVFPRSLRVNVSSQQIISVSLRPAAISQNILHRNNSLCSQNSTSRAHTRPHAFPLTVRAVAVSRLPAGSFRLHYAGVRLRFRLVPVRSITYTERTSFSGKEVRSGMLESRSTFVSCTLKTKLCICLWVTEERARIYSSDSDEGSDEDKAQRLMKAKRLDSDEVRTRPHKPSRPPRAFIETKQQLCIKP